MKKNYEFITVRDYITEKNQQKEQEIISAISYIEKLKKEILPNEFAV